MADIDIGAAAIDRSNFVDIQTKTQVGKDNPANASGQITSNEIWLEYCDGTNDIWVGTFSAVVNVLTCRDSESVGNVVSGSKQTQSGLEVTVETGDYWGCHNKNALADTDIEADTTGGANIWYYDGECIDPTDTQSFSVDPSAIMSLYGEGAVAGEEYVKSLTEALAIVDTRLLSIGTIKSDVTTIADTFLSATTIKRVLSDALTPADTLTRQATIGRLFSDALSLVDTLTRATQIKRVITGSLSLVDSIARNTGKVLSDAPTIVDTLIRQGQFSRTLTEAISLVDTAVKTSKRILSATITLGDSMLRASARTIANALTVVDTFSRRVEFGRTITEALTILDTPISKIRLYIDDTIGLVDTVSKAATRVLTETIDIVDTIRKLRGRIIVYLHSRALTLYLHSRSLAMKIHKGIPRGVRSSDE